MNIFNLINIKKKLILNFTKTQKKVIDKPSNNLILNPNYKHNLSYIRNNPN